MNAIPHVATVFPALVHNLGMQEWAKRFRAHMKRHKLSQETLAEGLNPPATQGAVGHWLRGRNQISLETFLQLCSAAGADPREILFGQLTAEAALEALRDRVVATNPDQKPEYRQFEGKLAETIPPKAPRTARKAAQTPKRGAAASQPQERSKAR